MAKRKKTPKKVTNVMLWKQLGIIENRLNANADWQSHHEVADDNRFKDGDDRMSTLATTINLQGVKNLLVEEDGTTLKVASKKDVEELMAAFHKFTQALALIQGGSKWTLRALLTIATLVVSLGTIFGGWKVLWAYVLASFKP